ncbi:MAG: 50S ribosomal protein L9 [Bacteroidetes bacterium]|nr:50S ribosomal protein L9 [Bacteroidota bacterium]
MELILLQDVENLGERNDIVTVKNGYGRNYLIPQGLATIASASKKKHALEIKKQQSAKALKQIEDMQAIADSLASKTLQVGAKAGTSGKLFGSVTNIQLADAIKKQFGIEIDRRKIKLKEEIKSLGTYKAAVELHREVSANIEFEVVQD